MTATLRAQIAARKQELLEFLRNYDQSAAFFPPPISPRAAGRPAPLSFAQERLWFLEQLEPGAAVYNICRASRLNGKLHLTALEASLNEIVRRHQVLRSAIRVADGQPVQVAELPYELKLSVVDLQAMSEIEREPHIKNRIQQAAETPFDFAAGKFLRAELLRLGNDEHILILTTHHIVSDAWSMGILTRELWSLYETYAAGKSSRLEELAVKYADFAIWQRDWLRGEVLESQLSYWKKQLDELPILNLPTDRIRPARQSFHGARVPIILAEPLSEAINELSIQCGATPFMALLAAFQVLLYRYSGQEDVVVGSPIANRGRSELESLIGFFVNTLVLRADLSSNPTFKEFVARFRAVCLDAYAHQDLPFEKLVLELQPERDQSRNPLFQVMFVLQNATRSFSGIPGLRIEPLVIERTRSPLDLSLFLREREGKYIGHIEYSTDLFNRDRIERMAGHFEILLEGIIANPDEPISTLPILTNAERQQILIEWNDTAADYPKDKCIHELFEEQVEKTPDAIAVFFDGQELTYRELNTRANQLAHYLRGLGVGPEVLVGICVERSLEMVVGLLAILKAGGAYVPLDPAYPVERLKFMLEDARVSVVVTQECFIENGGWRIEDSELRSSILNHRFQVICVNRDWEVISRRIESNVKSGVRANNLAYVIYTSGSTGTPKGVSIEHRNTVALLHWARTVFGSEELSGVLASTSICFDLSVFELFVPLCLGGTVILAGNVLHLHRLLERNKIALINTVPSAMTGLLKINDLPESVRTLNLAGEPLRSDLVEQLYGCGNVNKVYDLYGPSETTTYSTFTLRPSNGRETIGRPIANSRIYILDGNLQPVPTGVTGEIFIGGAGVARGYLNRPDLTAEKFMRNPFREERDDRLYRTGDLGRYLPDGKIEFLGRNDKQVKIRGYRIEPGEIETALNQHPTIKESVVVARDRNLSGKKDLIGYFVPKEPSPVAISGLRNFLREKLPDYMVPSLFVKLEVLPLSPNGKIDRNALPPPDDTTPGLEETYVQARTQVEELLAQIWEEVLRIEGVGIHDNFFELGGHSLLAIQIVSRLRDAFDKEVALSDVFDAPTIAGLAGKIEKTIGGRAHDLPPILRVPRDGPLPLSLNQEHLWRLDQMMPGTHCFNMPYVYRLTGSLNCSALEKSLQEIIRRHEALRTVFGEVDGRPVQIIKDIPNFQLPYFDLRGVSAEAASHKAARFILEEREGPFDLASGPLVRVKLLRVTTTDYLLLVTMHHIISDYWSMQIFRSELTKLYKAFVLGRPSPLPEPTIQFADYVCWERRCLESGLWDAELDYWTKHLAAPLPRIEFQTKGERKEELSFQISHQAIEIDENLLVGIKDLARRENCTPFMVLIATLNILIYLHTGRTNIWIGTLVANRSTKETETVIGHVMNTVNLRLDLFPDMTFKQLLRQVRDITLAAYSRQALPFECLLRVFEEDKNIDRDSLCQFLVIYNTASSSVVELPGLTFASLVIKSIRAEMELAISTFDLIFDLKETSTKLTGSVNYNRDTFDNKVITAMTDAFLSVLKKFITRTGERI